MRRTETSVLNIHFPAENALSSSAASPQPELILQPTHISNEDGIDAISAGVFAATDATESTITSEISVFIEDTDNTILTVKK